MSDACRLLAIVVLGALLTGCGKSDHQRLVDDANRICRDGDRQIKALPRATGTRSLAAAADKQAAIIEEARARLGKLEPPAGDRHSLAQYLAALDVTVRTTRVIALAARAGKVADIQAQSRQARQDNLKLRRLARGLGLSDCARSSS